jgi:hypothetical protein
MIQRVFIVIRVEWREYLLLLILPRDLFVEGPIGTTTNNMSGLL